jgi:hypothetical protein
MLCAATTTYDRPPTAGPVECVFPSPTEAQGVHRLWRWTLPGRAITWLSLACFAAVTLGLSATAQLRELCHLPLPPEWIAFASAAMAAAVAWAGRRRPGRLLPRAWALTLAGGSALLGLLARDPRLGDEPAMHAAVAGAAAAAAVLALRLARPAATGRWTDRMVLGATCFAIVLLLAGVPLAARWARGYWRSQVGSALAEIVAVRGLAVHAAAGPANLDEAQQQTRRSLLAAVEARPLGRWLGRDRLWRAARALGRERELIVVAGDALRAVAMSLSARQGPSLARLTWPAVWFDRERGTWVEDPRFAASSDLVRRHYRVLEETLQSLRPAGEATATLPGAALAARFDGEWQRWLVRQRELQASWSDGWVVAAPSGDSSASTARLSELLGHPVFGDNGRALRPFDLWALMAVPGNEAWAMGSRPGCLRHRYTEDDVGLLRADCFAYAARPNGIGATLLIEVRLVYRVPTLALDLDRAAPYEVYFLFPVPEGRPPEAYQIEVLSVVAPAVEAAHPSLRFEADRSGTSVRGFRLVSPQRTLRVRSRLVPHVPTRQAVELRAFWERDGIEVGR